METKKLYRHDAEGQLGGVAAGLAAYLNVDVSLVRLIFVLLTLINGLGVVVYVVMWLLVPTRAYADYSGEQIIRENVTDMKNRLSRMISSVGETRGSSVVGGILLSIGAIFLINQFVPFLSFGILLSLALIGAGVLMLITQLRSS